MTDEFRRFKTNLTMLLRDMPPGATADFSDAAVAFWDGTQVMVAYLRDGRPDEVFEFDQNTWESWRGELDVWLASPAFTERVELAAGPQSC